MVYGPNFVVHLVLIEMIATGSEALSSWNALFVNRSTAVQKTLKRRQDV